MRHQEHVASYQKQGAVCIRQLLSQKEIEVLRTGIEQNLRAPSPRAKIASYADDPGYFIEDFCNWQDNPYYKKVIFESPLSSVAALLMIESQRQDFPIIGWELEPGDVVAFHMLTLHAAAGVDGPNRRRVFSVRFLGDDVTHAPRSWKTSPEFPGLHDSIPAGAPMEGPLFPVLTRGELRP